MAKKQKDTLVHTAETIGAALGHVAVRLDSWKKQRASIAAEVRAIATAAQAMLVELGHAAETELKRARKAGRRKGPSAAQLANEKRRAAWKGQRGRPGGANDEHTKPPDVRSMIRATEGKRWTARQRGRG